MACKDICLRYKASRPIGTGRYFSGQKRCQVCNIFIMWDELCVPMLWISTEDEAT